MKKKKAPDSILTDLLKESIKQEKAKNRPATFSELERGDSIKHPLGVLKFVSKSGSSCLFKDENGDNVVLIDLNNKYRRV